MRLGIFSRLLVCSSGVYSSLVQPGCGDQYVSNNETQLLQLPSNVNRGSMGLLKGCESVCKNVQENMNTGGWRITCAEERKRSHGEILGRACKIGLQSVLDRCLDTCVNLLSEQWVLEEWDLEYSSLDGCVHSCRQYPVPQGGKACFRGLTAGIGMINQAIDAFLEMGSISIGHSHRNLVVEKNENLRTAKSERAKLKFKKRGQGCRTCRSGR